VHRITDCVADCILPSIPEPTEWQHIGNQVNTAMIFARPHFLGVQSLFHNILSFIIG